MSAGWLHSIAQLSRVLLLDRILGWELALHVKDNDKDRLWLRFGTFETVAYVYVIAVRTSYIMACSL